MGSEAADPLVGKLVSDRYRIIRKLGEGGMGAVYLAEHVLIEKKVALKVLAPELARRNDLAARFLQEARSASRIGHENVIDISDYGQSAEGSVYIAMEFLDGVDLGKTVGETGPLPWARAKGIVLQICRALRAAHGQGIVHRDMKPENIFLIQREGRPDFVKLLDFGIAKVMGMDNTPRLTRTGMIFGTPEYMAPEQAEGKDADHRADIYAVGCVIYHLVTGAAPFAAPSFMAMLTKHLLEDPVAPGVRRPDLGIPAALDALVLKALEKDRARRMQNMQEMIAAVEACEAVPAVGRSSATRELGGGEPVAARTVVGQEADVDAPTVLGTATTQSPVARAARFPGRRVALVVAGTIAGTSAALWWALSERPAPAPTAVAPTPPSPPGVAKPTPSPPSPAEAPAEAKGPAATAEHPATTATRPAAAAARKERAGVRRPATAPRPSSGTPKPPKETTPAGLKPFPGQ